MISIHTYCPVWSYVGRCGPDCTQDHTGPVRTGKRDGLCDARLTERGRGQHTKRIACEAIEAAHDGRLWAPSKRLARHAKSLLIGLFTDDTRTLSPLRVV